ncbi:glycoside hydrolase family 3 N-terminal domain-containing protein [Arthrobacter sp. B2a2-09]|uniref:glycoside hydrolase family 3 N-terminal domain-containing protein n=1 Tax=Arthrobacter sp. B2a2-09 TaxID=2952822 RepID=UPI0022CD73A7|nr:glycoside hydrolase family 3 N-terminal domain-containing protein [Arthrobacter sp. B2a2-09]MCZ9880608.1 glycoside hydrolase family 3 C-terminal domain-containing protein [Arthrobacter sp. B2a2-09]
MKNPTYHVPMYKDATQPIEDRVADLVQRMTLDEKVAQLRSLWVAKFRFVTPEGRIDADKARDVFPDGIGFIGRPVDAMGMEGFMQQRWHRSREESIQFVNEMQEHLLQNTRLGIPAFFHDETGHGFVAAGATVFPIPPALASTWDEDLVEKIFTVVAREARSVGSLISLSPVLDLARDPRYGRVEEFFSEDPFLAGRMGVAVVRGLQGRSRPLAEDRMFATLKHFVHATPEGGVNVSPAPANERSLRETYLIPFADVVREADPAFIMPSYNEVGGMPAHASRDLLQRIGRELLGFEGAYLSDYGAIERLVSNHRVAADLGEAAGIALRAGVDADLADGDGYAELAAEVRMGRVDEALVDAAVSRLLALKFEAGLFDRPTARLENVEYNDPEARDLAHLAAVRSLTLLSNDGVLPLSPSQALRVGVIGPNADQVYYGNYSGETDSGVSVLAGIREAIGGTSVIVEYAEGVRLIANDAGVYGPGRMPIVPEDAEENRRRIAEAVDVARRSDVVVLVVGDHPAITRETTRAAYPGDRSELGLFGQQDELVEALLDVGVPVVALLINGRPLAVTRLAEKANALLEGWYLGQEGGRAVAEVLFGSQEPGGRLPVSIPRSAGSLPVYYNRHTSANLYPYVEVERTPLYPFGHGLGYSTFDISEPVLESSGIRLGESAVVSVEVSNIGDRSGSEVVQMYIRDDVSSVPRPEIELRGFERVTLEPGATMTVRFTIEPAQLAFWNVELTEHVAEPGSFTISVGRSSADLRTTTLMVEA